ncbi:MAG: tetratricopeptide repeat protein, partial [bacterium]
EKKELDKALQDFDKAIELDPLYANGYYSRGSLYYQKKEYDKAKETLYDTLSKSPDKASIILNDLALYSLSSGNHKDAIDYLNEALAKDPDNEKTYLRLATVYQSSDQSDLAIDIIKKGIKKIPNSISLRTSLGMAYNRIKKYDYAIKEFSEALDKTDPDNSNLHFLMASTYLQKKDDKKAEHFYKRAIQLDPNNSLAYNDLAWFYAERGQNLKQSLNLAENADKLTPNNPYIIDTIGWIYLKMEKYNKAIEMFNRAVDLGKDIPTLKYHLAVALHTDGEDEKALVELNHALSIKKEFPEKKEAQNLLRELTK